MTNKNTADNNNTAAHEIVENRSPSMIAAHSFIETVKNLREEQAHEDYIRHLYAHELQNMVEPKQYGDFVAIVNKNTGLHYTVKALKEYDLNTPVLKDVGITGPIEIARRQAEQLDARVKRGEDLTADEMTALNISRQQVKTYEAAIASGKAPAEAVAQVQEAMTKEIEQSLIGLEEANKGWLQPKFIAAGTALAAAGFNVVANNKYNIGAITGGLGGAAVSYFGAEYLFTKVEAIHKLPELVKTGLAASAGTALGLGGVMLGELVQTRFIDNVTVENDGETITVTTPSAIPAPTAELAAYL